MLKYQLRGLTACRTQKAVPGPGLRRGIGIRLGDSMRLTQLLPTLKLLQAWSPSPSLMLVRQQ